MAEGRLDERGEDTYRQQNEEGGLGGRDRRGGRKQDEEEDTAQVWMVRERREGRQRAKVNERDRIDRFSSEDV